MAAAAGGAVGELVELSTEGVARPVMERAYAADAAVMAQGAATSLSPGELTVSARVTGRWRFDRE